MTPSLRLTGQVEFDRKLRTMGDVRAANRIAGSTLGAEATVFKKGMQALSPPWLKETIGVRKGKNRNKVYEVKVGVNVGKRKKNSKKTFSGWGPAFVVGTIQRVRHALGGAFKWLKNPTASQLRTGQIAPHPVVKHGFASSKGAAESKGREAFKRAVDRERAKAQLNK